MELLVKSYEQFSANEDFIFDDELNDFIMTGKPRMDQKVCNFLLNFVNFVIGLYCIVSIITIRIIVFPKGKNCNKRELPHIRCSDPRFPGYGENAIDLSASLSRSTLDFQKIEWSMLMNEKNFLKEWDEEWIGVYESRDNKSLSDW